MFDSAFPSPLPLTFVLLHGFQITELQLQSSGLETERDFYFSKLRDIELICQENEGEPIVASILEIMYATQVSGLHFVLCCT